MSLDVESRSAADLKKVGAYRYWQDPTTELIVACYAFDDGPAETWRPGDDVPDEILDHVFTGGRISAWNAGFERLAWKHFLARHRWPEPGLHQWEDTAAAAAALGLPRNLGDAARALGLDQQKDDAGHRLMLQMSKPRRPRKGEEPAGLLWWEDDERMARLIAYCRKDVEAERAIRDFLVPLSGEEQEVWRFNERMNDRGVYIDRPLVEAMHRIVDQEIERLDGEMARLTGGAVTACSQVGRLKAWLQARGVAADSLAKAALDELLDDDLPDDARAVIELRKAAAKTSTAKLDAMLACIGPDNRARGVHLYHGAGTGRWSGRLIQTQNMPRGTGTVDDPEAAVPDFLLGDRAWIAFHYGDPMSAVSDMLRACIAAPR